MGSAAEAKIGTCYINSRKLLSIRVCAEEIVHPQGPNPEKVDNTTVVGFVNKTIKQKCQKQFT